MKITGKLVGIHFDTHNTHLTIDTGGEPESTVPPPAGINSRISVVLPAANMAIADRAEITALMNQSVAIDISAITT